MLSAGWLKCSQNFADKKFEFIFTLCREIREICSPWPDQPEACALDFLDPSEGQVEPEKEILMLKAVKEICDRVKHFAGLTDGQRKPYQMASL